MAKDVDLFVLVGSGLVLVPARAAAGRGHFRPHMVDDSSGVRLRVVTGDGAPDILTASKLGSLPFVTKRGRISDPYRGAAFPTRAR